MQSAVVQSKAEAANRFIQTLPHKLLKTIIQMIVLTILFFTPQVATLPGGNIILNILIWIMVAITIISGVDYLIKNKEVIKIQ